MVINIRVQYNSGFLPDIILLTQSYYHYWGTRLNTMQWLCIYENSALAATPQIGRNPALDLYNAGGVARRRRTSQI